MRNLHVLIGICLVYWLVIFYHEKFILTDAMYYTSFYKKFSEQQILNMINSDKRWNIVAYLFIIPVVIIRAVFSWVCLKSGSFITERFTEAAFWKICIQAEIVFAIGAVAGLLYTEFFVDVETLEQLSINPFSLQIFTADSMPKWSSYFFNTLNIFEIGYVFVLAYLIAEEAKSKVLPTLKFVASTYLPGLALWVMLVSYLSVVFQP